MSEYLLDANALIAWLKGSPEAVALFDDLIRHDQVLGVNAIAVAEIYAGLGEDETEPADRMFSTLAYWPIHLEVARLSGALRYRYRRLGRPLTVPDTLMAAHAISRDAVLLTAKVRDFPMPELKLQPLP